MNIGNFEGGAGGARASGVREMAMITGFGLSFFWQAALIIARQALASPRLALRSVLMPFQPRYMFLKQAILRTPVDRFL